MKSAKRAKANKRAGITLSPDAIDAAKATNDHLRDEKLKDTINLIRISAIWIACLAVPVIYVIILISNWGNEAARNDWLEKGLVAVVSFGIAKVDFGQNGKSE